MAIVSTPGSEFANSYISVADANDYVSSKLGAAWPTDTSQVENLLIESTRLVDCLFDWFGEKSTDTQALEWPRDGSTEVPLRLQHATVEAAMSIYASGGFTDSSNNVKSVEVGPIVVDLDSYKSSSGLSPLCISMLRNYGVYSGPSAGVKQVRIVRS